MRQVTKTKITGKPDLLKKMTSLGLYYKKIIT